MQTSKPTSDATIAVSIRLPSLLLSKIDFDVETWNKAHPKSPETRSDRIIYLLQYAHDAGTLNQFIDLMKTQYLDLLSATPQQLSQGVSSYNQVQNLADRIAEIDEKLETILSRISE
jgi:hypothetical protein